MDLNAKERQVLLATIYSASSESSNTPEQPIRQPEYVEPVLAGVEVNPDTIHNNTYTYIDKRALAKQFSDFQNYKKSQTVHFCLYRVNLDCDLPFIQYALDNSENGNSYEFLKKQFVCHTTQSTVNAEELSQCIIAFNNFCIETISDSLEIHEELTPYTMKTDYDGFMEKSGDNIYVFFNCSAFKHVKFPKTMKWCLIDTMIYSKIDDTRVSNKIKSFFEENPELIYIKNNAGNAFPLPKELIICIEKNGEYIPDQVILKDDVVKIYPMPIKTVFGSMFIFLEPANPSFFSFFWKNTPVKYNKYAVFIDKIKHLSGELVDKTDKLSIRNIMNYSENEQYSGLYFKYKTNQYYSIKSTKNFTDIL